MYEWIHNVMGIDIQLHSNPFFFWPEYDFLHIVVFYTLMKTIMATEWNQYKSSTS